jgi:hypothetical protein
VHLSTNFPRDIIPYLYVGSTYKRVAPGRAPHSTISDFIQMDVCSVSAKNITYISSYVGIHFESFASF